MFKSAFGKAIIDITNEEQANWLDAIVGWHWTDGAWIVGPSGRVWCEPDEGFDLDDGRHVNAFVLYKVPDSHSMRLTGDVVKYFSEKTKFFCPLVSFLVGEDMNLSDVAKSMVM